MLSSSRSLILLVTSLLSSAEGFVGPSTVLGRPFSTRLQEGMGQVEQIEFKIYPDGRVEETVRGIKGGNCHKVTEKINEQLGKVISSEPTEEMYEQEVVVDQTLTNTVGDATNGDSWEGKSSW